MAHIEINGAPVEYEYKSLSIELEEGKRSTAAFRVLDDGANLALTQGNLVEIYENVGDPEPAFAGVVANPSETSPVEDMKVHTVDCIDWHYLADKRRVSKAYQNTTAGAIVQDLVDTYLADEGVTVADIEDGPLVTRAVFNYDRTVAEALDDLAKRAVFWWYIDPMRRLHFVSRARYAAPFVLKRDRVKSASAKRANHRYRNRQFVIGGKDTTAQQVESRSGDGNTQSFVFGFPLAEKPTVEVNGVEQTVGIKGLDDPGSHDWYWSKGDPVIKQDEGAAPLGVGDMLTVTYRGQYPVVVMAQDDDEIAAQKSIEGDTTSGIVEHVTEEPSLTDRAEAIEYATSEQRFFGKTGHVFSFVTDEAGLAPGQLLTVDMPPHTPAGAPIDVLVSKVQIHEVGAGSFMYTVKAAEEPYLGSWADFFLSIMRRRGTHVEKINVGDETVLVVLAKVSEDWSWSGSSTVTAHACPIPAPDLLPAPNLLPC